METYSMARKYAKARDGTRCVCCGNRGNLTLHHILPKCDYPQYYTNENNLVTLCIRCHRRFHDDFCKGSKFKVTPDNLIKYLWKYAKDKSVIEPIEKRMEELEYGN